MRRRSSTPQGGNEVEGRHIPRGQGHPRGAYGLGELLGSVGHVEVIHPIGRTDALGQLWQCDPGHTLQGRVQSGGDGPSAFDDAAQSSQLGCGDRALDLRHAVVHAEEEVGPHASGARTALVRKQPGALGPLRIADDRQTTSPE